MKTLVSLFLLLIVLAVSGCATWKKIPAAPEYTHAESIPLKVGVVLLQENPAIGTKYLPGLEAIKGLKEMQLFDSLIYPYTDSLIYPYEGDPVDVVMQLIIAGGWEGYGSDRTATHDVRASIKK